MEMGLVFLAFEFVMTIIIYSTRLYIVEAVATHHSAPS